MATSLLLPELHKTAARLWWVGPDSPFADLTAIPPNPERSWKSYMASLCTVSVIPKYYQLNEISNHPPMQKLQTQTANIHIDHQCKRPAEFSLSAWNWREETHTQRAAELAFCRQYLPWVNQHFTVIKLMEPYQPLPDKDWIPNNLVVKWELRPTCS